MSPGIFKSVTGSLFYEIENTCFCDFIVMQVKEKMGRTLE